ncbi:MerR family transcriptional regulator, partial [Rhodococcus hoagii]|nr:MerR family transcriptional regulator [Prescottella equi]
MHTKGDTPHSAEVRQNSPDAAGPGDKFDDEDFPAYSMGRAAEILGVTQAF